MPSTDGAHAVVIKQKRKYRLCGAAAATTATDDNGGATTMTTTTSVIFEALLP